MKKEKSILEYSSLKEAMRNTGYIDQSINMDYVKPIAKYDPNILRKSINRLKKFLFAKKAQIVSSGGIWLEWVRNNAHRLKKCMDIIESMRRANNFENCKCAKCHNVLGKKPTYEAHVRKNYNGLLGLCDSCENEIVPFR